MPLGLLLGLVIGGISAITLLLHLTGHSRTMVLSGETARAQWLRHAPGLPPRAIHLSPDGKAALVETDDGPGLLWVMGADSTGHMAAGATLTDTRDGLDLRLPDFAAPRLRVALPAPDRARWRALLTAPKEHLS